MFSWESAGGSVQQRGLPRKIIFKTTFSFKYYQLNVPPLAKGTPSVTLYMRHQQQQQQNAINLGKRVFIN
jgi:hypothetical protein